MVQNNGRSHWTDERLDNLADRVDGITLAVQENQQQIANTSLAVERLADVVMQVAIKVENQVETIAQQQAVIAQQQTAMNAEQERQGRILDYLMRQDGERQP